MGLRCWKRRRQWHPTPVLLLGKSHGRRSLEGCSPWGRWGSDTTERLHFHFSLSCIGEGNGNSLQCSCLENPRDGGAWWAAVYGVSQSRTRLKWLSSSSSCWKVFAEPHKTLGFLASRGEEFNLGLVMRLDHSDLLCNKVLLKYKRDRESFWHRQQKGEESVSPC